MMQVPTVGSVVKIKVRYNQGPRMIPPQPDYHVYHGTVLKAFKWLTDRQFCLSGDEFWPIRVITIDQVEDITLESGTMQELNTDLERFEVSGSKGNKYIVTKSKSGWNCTCPGFQFRSQCKHVSELSGSTV